MEEPKHDGRSHAVRLNPNIAIVGDPDAGELAITVITLQQKVTYRVTLSEAVALVEHLTRITLSTIQARRRKEDT